MKSVAFHNLGCKVNSYETDYMRQNFQKNGYQVVQFAQKADVYVINTCTVTNIADRKSRQMIHRARTLNPDALIVAVGCYVQTHEAEVQKDPTIDLAVGNNRKHEIVELVEACLAKREQEAAAGDAAQMPAECGMMHRMTAVSDLSVDPDYEELPLSGSDEHTRIYLKIQDGCNQFCSYCVIPHARGRVRSRKPEKILAEAERMAEKGYREVVLTGIHISSYGLDFAGQSYNAAFRNGEEGEFAHSGALLQLIEDLSAIEGIERIRLSSLEPRIITKSFAGRLAANRKVCPHFHLSLQSGCDSVLSRMNRHYSCADFEKSVGYLREAFEDPAITTDLIAGFPGETEEEFEETLSFTEGIGFYETHVFPYSRRKNTVADKMPGQLTERVKKQRCHQLLVLNERQSESYRKRHLGRVLPVLFEREYVPKGEEGGKNGCFLIGHTPNYLEVFVPCSEETVCGLSREVRLSELTEEGIFRGEPV